MFPQIKELFNIKSIDGIIEYSQKRLAELNEFIPGQIHGASLALGAIEKPKQLLENDPEKLLQGINQTIYELSSALDYYGFHEDTPELREKQKDALLEAVKIQYRLELIRDSIEQKVYGQASGNPKEKKKIDEIRETIKSPRKEEKNEPNEIKVWEFISQLINQDEEKIENAKKRNAATPAIFKSIVEEFKSRGRDQETITKIMIEIIKRIKANEEKTTNDPKEKKKHGDGLSFVAERDAINKVVDEISPKISEIISSAFQKDKERQLVSQKPGNKGVAIWNTRMFMTELYRKFKSSKLEI